MQTSGAAVCAARLRFFDRGSETARRKNLLLNGATPKEAELLLDKRVELNALTSDQLVAFIERKLKQHGVKKVVPAKQTLDDAYRLFARSHEAEQIIERELAKLKGGTDVKVPSDLGKAVRRYLEKHPLDRWDDAVSAIVQRTLTPRRG
jgi:hypothetical protein